MNEIVKLARTQAETDLADNFASRNVPLAKWLEKLQGDAFSDFSESGLPNRRVEEWKYTDLKSAMKDAKPLAGADEAASINVELNTLPFSSLDLKRAVFVNGHFRSDLSDISDLSDGLTVSTFAQAVQDFDELLSQKFGKSLGEHDITIANLNASFASDGLVIKIAEGVDIEETLALIFINSGEGNHASHVRNIVVSEADSSFKLVEAYVGDTAEYQSTSTLEVFLSDKSKLQHVRYQSESDTALHLGQTAVRLQNESHYSSVAMTLGSKLARHQLHMTFEGEHANGSYAEASMLRGNQHADTTIFADHLSPNCESSELYKGVLDDRANGVFQGKILVRPHAQHTDARQSSHAILLNDAAEMDLKPELEIFADDVQCAHGATVGEIDENMLFYLKARGIPAAEAKAMLIAAFIDEAFDGVEDEDLREALTSQVTHWLQNIGS